MKQQQPKPKRNPHHNEAAECESRFVAIYARVSTDKQESEQQLEQCRRACRRKFEDTGDEMFAEPLEYRDDDVSGKIDFQQRVKGADLWRHIERHTIKHIIVAKLDRLGRSAKDTLQVVEFCREHRVNVEFLWPQVDTSGAMGKLFLTILAAFAEMEAEMIRERTRDALQHRRESGKCYGKVPYGYDAIETGLLTKRGKPERALVPNEDEQSVIQMIITRRIKRKQSWKVIVKWLNEKGIKTKNGKRWLVSGVRRIVENKCNEAVVTEITAKK